MKKGVLITLLVALLLVLAVPVALALTDGQKAELEALYRQEHELRLQILEKQKEAGLIDEEQAGFNC
jgi:cytochrome c oxidase assembly factor CtaG